MTVTVVKQITEYILEKIHTSESWKCRLLKCITAKM